MSCMNEFTKEELQYLFRNFMLTNSDDFEHNLEAKLQGMIDKYCEHKKIGFLGDVYGYECKDCGSDISRNLITDEQHERSMHE